MNCCVACLFVLGVVASEGVPQTGTKSDAEGIQGLWNAVSAETEGKPVAKEIVKDMHLAFAGNRMIAFGEDDVADAIYVFQLNPKGKPKQIDLKLSVQGKTMTGEGIYSLEGDTLKICWDTDGGKRPASFDTPREGRVISIVLKRQKP
jgi:uncharacterized protein (TIGR03067 family)